MIKKYFLILFLLVSAVTVWADSAAPAVVDEDDRVEITDNAQGLEKAAVVLEMIDNDDMRSYCSGAMVGPNIVLTAAHCVLRNGRFRKTVNAFAVAAKDNTRNLNSQQDTNDRQFFNTLLGIATGNYIENVAYSIHRKIGQDIDTNKYTSKNSLSWNFPNSNSTFYSSATAIDLQVHDELLENADNIYSPQRDYAIVILDKPIGYTTGWFGLRAPNDKRLTGSDILLIGRPGDKKLNTLWKSEGTIATVHTYGTFDHNADSLPGNSGGPIFLKENPNEIIGLVSIAHVPDERVEKGHPNIGLIISEEIIELIKEQLMLSQGQI